MQNVIRTNHVGITVSNLDHAIESFERLFGYELHHRSGRHARGVELLTGVSGADIEVAHLQHPDLIGIELIVYRAPADAGRITGHPCDTGHIHLTFDVTDIAAMIDTALELGFKKVGRVVQSAKIASEGQQVVYLRNADGLTIELIQPPVATPHAG